MADIDITRSHDLGKDGAREAVQDVANQLEEQLGATHRWNGDTLHFERGGADGRLQVGENEVHLRLNLQPPLSLMKGQIRKQAEQLLDDRLKK